MQNEVKILTRGKDSIIAGVCSGLAEHYNLHKNGLRLAFLLATLFFALPIVVYIALWLILPKYPTSQAMVRHLRRKGARSQNGS